MNSNVRKYPKTFKGTGLMRSDEIHWFFPKIKQRSDKIIQHSFQKIHKNVLTVEK